MASSGNQGELYLSVFFRYSVIKLSFSHPEVILKFRDLISKLEKDVEAVIKLEREEREFAASEAKVHLHTSHRLLPPILKH